MTVWTDFTHRMAGINQHYIPQFLQRGFASHKLGKTSFVWEYRVDRTYENKTTKKVGAEDEFYTECGDTTIDDTITRAENPYANLVNRLRAMPVGAVNEPEIPELLAHFEVRTRNLRQTLIRHGQFVLNRLMQRLQDPNTIEKLVRQTLSNDPQFLRAQLAKQLIKQPRRPQDLNAEINKWMKRKAEWLPRLLLELTPVCIAMAASLSTLPPLDLKTTATAAHLRALKASIQPPLRAAALTGIGFQVMETGGTNLILGDSGAIFRLANPDRFRPYTDKGDKIAAAFLPLAPQRVLVGMDIPCRIDFVQLKRQIARCSLEFSVAHERSEENAALLPQIGEDAEIISEAELEAIVAECLRDALS